MARTKTTFDSFKNLTPGDVERIEEVCASIPNLATCDHVAEAIGCSSNGSLDDRRASIGLGMARVLNGQKTVQSLLKNGVGGFVVEAGKPGRPASPKTWAWLPVKAADGGLAVTEATRDEWVAAGSPQNGLTDYAKKVLAKEAESDA